MFILTFIGFSSVFHSALSVPDKEVLRADLREEWLFFDENTESFLPFLPDMHHNKLVPIHLIAETKRSENDFFYISVRKGEHIFLNNLLVHIAKKDFWYELSSEKLTLYGKKVLISLYSDKSRSEAPVSYRTKAAQTPQQLDEEVIYSPYASRAKKMPIFRDFMIVISLMLMLLISVTNRRSDSLFDSSMWLDKLADFIRPVRFSVKLNTLDTIIFVILSGFVLAHLIMIFEEHSTWIRAIKNLKKEKFGWLHYTGSYLSKVFFVTIILVLKYLTVTFVSQVLFTNRQVALIHTQTFLRYGKVFLALNYILGGFLSLVAYKTSDAWINFFFVILLLGLFLHSVIISFFVFRSINLKKLYLFSYLCGTEFIPFFLIVKLFL